ncbi:hypothetical protein BGX28_008230 [Mortierella sp. GBA30]|nr:hypothetical protein BGX28_008230 [Mortierella sp. GBA30]
MNEARTHLQNKIHSFLSSSRPLLVLDTRPRAVFRKRHLSPSTNIPVHSLGQSWFQLPPKQTPFAVIESSQEITNGTEDHRTIPYKVAADDPFAAGLGRPSDILRHRGWRPDWTFEDHPLFWSIMAEELSFSSRLKNQNKSHGLEVINKTNQASSSNATCQYHFLFKPNPILAKILPLIERRLVEARQQQAAFQSSSAFSRSQPLNSSYPGLFRCLDVGCGSGRDMTYMVARSANGLSVEGAEWTVLGMDQRTDACERALQLARDTFPRKDFDDNEKLNENDKNNDNNNHLASRVSIVVGKIDPKTGEFWISHSQPSLCTPRVDGMPQQEQQQQPLSSLQNVRHLDPAQDQLWQQYMTELEQKQDDPIMSSTTTTGPATLNDDRFDLIIMIRFLQRSLLTPLVQHWLRPGGFLLLSTFVSDQDLPNYSKPGPAHRLHSRTEAREIFERLGLEIVLDEISLIEDGARSVATVVAQKPIELE